MDKTQKTDFGLDRPVLGSVMAIFEYRFWFDLRFAKSNLGSEGSLLRSEMPDLGFERPDFGSEIPDLGSTRPDIG